MLNRFVTAAHTTNRAKHSIGRCTRQPGTRPYRAQCTSTGRPTLPGAAAESNRALGITGRFILNRAFSTGAIAVNQPTGQTDQRGAWAMTGSERGMGESVGHQTAQLSAVAAGGRCEELAGRGHYGTFPANVLEMLWRFPEHVPHVLDMFQKFQGFHHGPKPPKKAWKGSGQPIRIIKGNV